MLLKNKRLARRPQERAQVLCSLLEHVLINPTSRASSELRQTRRTETAPIGNSNSHRNQPKVSSNMSEDQHSLPPDSIPSDSADQGTASGGQPISSQVLKSAYNAFKKRWKLTRL